MVRSPASGLPQHRLQAVSGIIERFSSSIER
jgi:hypothetical protein